MADKKNKASEVKKATEEVTEEVKPVPKEDAYPIGDLIDASRAVFQVPPEVVVAALKPLGKEQMTVSEAQAAITNFMNKEVK